MLTQLPSPLIDNIFDSLTFEDICSIACVCSAFRQPAQLRLFRTIRIRTESLGGAPNHTESILSSPHLLQYPAALDVQCLGFPGTVISIDSLWSHIPKMYRLSYVELFLDSVDCARALSALESCGSAREVSLKLARALTPDMVISDIALPVHTLDVIVFTQSHQIATQLIQKCSQSLRRLSLSLENNLTTTFPFLPRLSELSLRADVFFTANDCDLVAWFPFLDQHPTITRLLLGTKFTLAEQPSPDLLPNLQFLKATPAVIGRLIPGRPVNDIHVMYPPEIAHGSHFPVDAILQSLPQPSVPITTLEINTDSRFPDGALINIVQALPKLRQFTLGLPPYEGSVALEHLLKALGRCKDMDYIRMSFMADDVHPLNNPLFWRDDFICMIQTVQENGAADLWDFAFSVYLPGRPQIFEAGRVAWLDVPSQPTLKGEWQFAILGASSEDSGINTAAPNAGDDCRLG